MNLIQFGNTHPYVRISVRQYITVESDVKVPRGETNADRDEIFIDRRKLINSCF
jgi:hypothetical protein